MFKKFNRVCFMENFIVNGTSEFTVERGTKATVIDVTAAPGFLIVQLDKNIHAFFVPETILEKLFPLYHLNPVVGDSYKFANYGVIESVSISNNWREWSLADSLIWFKNPKITEVAMTNKTFETVNIGETFVVSANDPLSGRYADGKLKAGDTAYRKGKKLGKKFSCVKQANGSVKITRVA